MSELTRDEIRRACEAAGWPWDDYQECALQPGASTQWRFHQTTASDPDRCNADAHAILEATGEDFDIKSGTFKGRRVYDCRVDGVWCPVQDTFREAAVRAVLAWAKAKETKG